MPYMHPAEHIRQVKEYVQLHLQEKITVQEIAQTLSLHPSYLNTCYCAQTGESIKAYVRRCKIEKAKEMLRNTNYSLTQIGASLGYFDQSHFSRAFQIVVGMTPGTYRNLSYM